MRMKNVMNPQPHTLREDNTVLQASEFMRVSRIRNLPVVDKNNVVIGLITYREIIDSLTTNKAGVPIKNVMIKEVKAVGPDTPLKGALSVMIENKFGCLPIVDHERKLLGLVTESDLLKVLYEAVELPEDFYINK